jgi:hypothetical protein
MTYPLEHVLKIRTLREKTALTRTRQAQQKVKEAVDCQLERERMLTDYRDTLKRQEDRLLKQAGKRKISVTHLANLQEKLHGMKSIETQYRLDVNIAAEKVKDTRIEAERVKMDFFILLKQKQKIEEHFNIWREAERIANEKRLEEDLDELGSQYRKFF